MALCELVRRAILPLSVVVGLALAGPSTAAAQCEVPKGYHTGLAELEYKLGVELYVLMLHTERFLADPDPVLYAKQGAETGLYSFYAGRDFVRAVGSSGRPQCDG